MVDSDHTFLPHVYPCFSDSNKSNQCFEIYFDHCRPNVVVQTLFLSPFSKSAILWSATVITGSRENSCIVTLQKVLWGMVSGCQATFMVFRLFDVEDLYASDYEYLYIYTMINIIIISKCIIIYVCMYLQYPSISYIYMHPRKLGMTTIKTRFHPNPNSRGHPSMFCSGDDLGVLLDDDFMVHFTRCYLVIISI